MRIGVAVVFWAGCLTSWQAAAQPAAEVVSIQGTGEYSLAPANGWQPAAVRQQLDAGTWLRTQRASRMSLLLADQTQATLDASSMLQLKGAEAGPARRSILDFQRGKGRFETKSPARTLVIGTPTGVAAIRGTEWLVEVEDDGRSLFTVVEGEIEISNDLGSISVGADEQGVLERGRPPAKRRVIDARERVQWVTSFEADPGAYAELRPGGRLAGRYGAIAASLRSGDPEGARRALEAEAARRDSPVAFLLLADLALARGDARAAADWLQRGAAAFPEEPRFAGALARAWMAADDMPRAREAAAAALARHPQTFETQLHAGEVARLDGDFAAAHARLQAATRLAPADWRGWFALGRLRAERGDVSGARAALREAHARAPREAAVIGELGALEAGAYRVAHARRLLEGALELEPDDFSTWAGLGLARLRAGDPEGAVAALRRATLLEPRYARAHIGLAVAYWQQGRARDALAQLATASRHDPRDPLPHQLRGVILGDLMRPGEAVAAAREALARQTYTKSLDVIANDLRGSANLGAPLAQLGLEAWALRIAQDSYDPLWAGSHLFLADRLAGKYAANSELMQGFLADPLAFGAPNRFQPLVPRPGSYGTVALRAARSSEESLVEPLGNVNGLLAEGRLAYFLEGARLKAWRDDRATELRASSVTAALGVRPRHDLGFFFYGNRLLPDARLGPEGELETHQLISGRAERADAGLLYRPGPDTQIWIKAGEGSERGHADSREASAPFFRDSRLASRPRYRDLQARAVHRREGGLEASATVERATFETRDAFERDAFPRSSATGARLVESVDQDIRDVSRTAELALRTRATAPLVAEAQLDFTRYDKTNDIVVRRDFAAQLTELEDDHRRSRWSPRVGLVWRAAPGLTLRGAWQQWLRPASIGSLRTPSTAGIVLDERFVLAGGTLERARVQLEWLPARDVLVTAFADRQEVDNLHSALAGVLNFRPDPTNLERLRNRSFEPLATLDDLEGFPSLSRGELDEAGVAVNVLAGARAAFFAEAVWTDSENTGVFPGARFPFLPRTRYVLGASWFPGARVSLAARVVRRGERFADEANAQRLPAEWSGALQAYWETRDKRWSVELIVAGIGAKSSEEAVGLVANLRF